MQKYGTGKGEAGIVAFDLGPGSITLQFSGGDRYIYTDESAGATTIASMQALAKAGRGLGAFMSTDLRARYQDILKETGSAQVVQSDANAGTLTKVLIDSQLLEKALSATGIKNGREVVELGLRTVVQLQAEQELLKMQGTVEWEGDLDEMRADK